MGLTQRLFLSFLSLWESPLISSVHMLSDLYNARITYYLYHFILDDPLYLTVLGIHF